jgi:tyrosinase
MGDAYNSPGDPVFYLHHTNLDRLFWSWQQEDLSTRLSDVSGPIVPFDYNNTVAGNVTLDFEINLYPLTGNFTLGELLNTEGKVLCYTYE